MQNFNAKTIREIALEMPQTTRVFEEFKIDYCCGGRKPFAEACASAGVDPQTVSRKLEKALTDSLQSVGFNYPEKKSAGELIDYIVEKHHVFTKKELVRLNDLMEKVCRKHGSQHAELFDLRATFNALADDLIPHMRKEETVLFPFIKTVESSLAFNLDVQPPHFKTLRNPVRMMMLEHDAAGDFLRKMREITNDYAAPADACPSFNALYFGLAELETDLHRHIHLENNVLFPQSIEMEKQVFSEEADSAFCCHSGA
jgi:regulator of cell morphogenesis and NO signaling